MTGQRGRIHLLHGAFLCDSALTRPALCDKRTGIMARWQARFCRHRQKRSSHVARNDRTRKLSRQRTRPGARRSSVCPGGETSLSQIACSEDARFSEFGHFLPRGRRSGAFMPLPLADPACRKRSSHRTGAAARWRRARRWKVDRSRGAERETVERAERAPPLTLSRGRAGTRG